MNKAGHATKKTITAFGSAFGSVGLAASLSTIGSVIALLPK